MLMAQAKLFYKQWKKLLRNTLPGKTLNEPIELTFLNDNAEMMK